MIKANELRIGNWVLDDGEPSIVSQLGFGGISFFTINNFNCNRETGSVIDSGIDKFKPIPLTPKILEKAGFDKSPTNGFYVNNAMWLEVTPFVTPIYCDGTGFRRYIGKHIKHLHQLQNLYFALTGEELQIQL